MSSITAILHTHNDASRIARAIESLRPCDEVLVIDHGSTDETCALAHRFGARVITAIDERLETRPYLQAPRHHWLLRLQPTEVLSEALEASLLEWKLADHQPTKTFGFSILEEQHEGWAPGPVEARLVHRSSGPWNEWMPQTEDPPVVLDGRILRLRQP